MKKVLGTILSMFFLFLLAGCSWYTRGLTTAETTDSSSATGTTISENPVLGTVTLEVYDASQTLVVSETVGYAEGDTLLSLLLDAFGATCQGEDGGADETCSYQGAYGTYLLGVGSVLADAEAHEYVAIYVNGSYALTGIDDTPLENGNVYAFKIATW